jgi:DNA-binding winged helix-turn-helix (wHTH) protein
LAAAIGTIAAFPPLTKEHARFDAELSFIADLSRDLARGRNVRERFGAIVQHLLLSIGFDTAGVYLAESGSKSLRLAAHHGLPPELVDTLEKTAWDRTPGIAMRATGPFVYEDLWSELRDRVTDEQWQRLSALRDRQKRVRSALWVPIRFGDETYGALGVGRHEWRTFSQADQRVIGTLANQIAVGIAQQRGNAGPPLSLTSQKVRYGPFLIDFDARSVQKHDQPARLTPREFDVFACLVRQAGTVVRRERLLSDVWGAEFRDQTQYLHVFLGRLRRKLEDDPSAPEYLTTAPGVGYAFKPPESSPTPAV